MLHVTDTDEMLFMSTQQFKLNMISYILIYWILW